MLLFIILVLIFSVPAVQTSIGRHLTKRINKDFKTNINIGKVGLQFNGDIELKEIYIEDYKQDTLISIAELNSSIINYKNLYNGILNFGDVDIDGLLLNIKTYKDTTDTNLDVFVARFDEDNPSTKKSTFFLSSSDVTITNGTFRLIDENRETQNLLLLDNLGINASNFLIEGSNVSTQINALTFKDKRGLVVKNMITDFEYTLTQMCFSNLNITTEKSTLNGHVIFNYKREDLKDFTDKVNVVANFEKSTVFLNDLNTFYNEFGKKQYAKLSVNLSGTLNNLFAKKLRVNTSTSTKIYGDIKFKNLFNSEANNFSMDGDFYNLSSNYNNLKALLPNILGKSIPSLFSELGDFRIKGKSFITSSSVHADLDMNTEIGQIISNLQMGHIDNIDDASYKGNIILNEFDLGKLINDPKVKSTSFNLDVNGKGFTLENLNTLVKGTVSNLNYNNYDYKNIEVSGQVGNRIFNGLLTANDKNFKLNFKGLADLSQDIKKLNFVADVPYANLKALNFSKKDSISVFNGNLNMSINGSSIDDAVGDIKFKNTTYKNEHDNYYFKDFAVKSKLINDERVIEVNSPDIITGRVTGNFKFKDIIKLTENSLGSLYTNYVPNVIEGEQYLDFNFNIYNKIIEVFFHDIKLAKNTFIKGRIESDENAFKLTFKSPKIELRNDFANAIQLEIDNGNPLYNTYLQVGSLKTAYYNVSKFNFINVTKRDTLFVKSEFKGGKRNKDNFNLNMFYTINKDNKSVVGFRKSDVKFKNSNWLINQKKDTLNKIVFDKTFQFFDINSIRMNHDDEEMALKGIIRDSTYKNIELSFNHVDLAEITPEIDSLNLAGNVNGTLKISQQEGVYFPSSDLTINNLNINAHHLGDLKANVIGNQSLTNYKVDVLLQNDNVKSLEAIGDIDVSKVNSNINLDIALDEFLLDPINPFGEGIITNIRGLISGQAKVTGNLKKPQITGDLLLNNAGLSIPYLNVDYSFDFDSRVNLKEQKFIFNNTTLTDSRYFSKALLNGYIEHHNFSDWSLGLEVLTNRLLVLNTEDSEEALYYGKGFIKGKAEITGPANQLEISVEGSTEKGTVFKIPLNDYETFGDNSYIHFLSPEEKTARQNGEIITNAIVEGLELDFDLDVNQNADIEIVIDRDSGSSIGGKGEGNLLIDINTNGKFEMWGDFIIYEGTYNFIYGGIFEKEFSVEQGGTIVWEGDPLQADVNIKAIYQTRANPSVLLDNPINRSIPVEVEINLTGKLEQPEPDFTFNFPNVSSTIKSELSYRLETREDRDRQAINVLTFGSFASDFNLGQQAYGTIEDRVNSLVNSLFEDENGKLQLGVNYQIGEQTVDYETDDRVGLTLSTKISDRVLINGKVGVPIGGVNETVIAGDVQIDILLNKDGTLTAKFFNRENDIRNFGEEIGYTQGVGLSYNVEFDTFKELLQIIFSGKNKKKKSDETKEGPKNENSDFPSYIKAKPKTIR